MEVTSLQLLWTFSWPNLGFGLLIVCMLLFRYGVE